MKAIKLTDQKLRTHGGFQFELGKKHRVEGAIKLCNNGFHCYPNSLPLALFLNPIHADFTNPRAFIAEVSGASDLSPTKWAFEEMTLLEELDVPPITTTQRVAFTILCALQISRDETFATWANNWLNETDRTAYTAARIATHAARAARAAADAADTARTATHAADTAYTAARIATHAADTARAAADAATHAADAAYAARAAADAADTARAATHVNPDLDLVTIATQAMEY